MDLIPRGRAGFTLDSSLGEWVLTHPAVSVKKKGKIYSVNEVCYLEYSLSTVDHHVLTIYCSVGKFIEMG